MTELNYQQRPTITQQNIDNLFKFISKHKNEDKNWVNNGKKKYKLCGIDDHALFKGYIKNHPEQTSFKVLDVGAGDSSWGYDMSKMFAKSYPDKTITIYTTTGENCVSGQDKNIHKFCKFKVENIAEEFGENLSGAFDFIVASQIMIHLVDPLGTYVQLVSLLKNDGLLLSNSFVFNLIDSEREYVFPIWGHEGQKSIGFRMYHTLIESQAKFLICPDFQYANDDKIYSPDVLLQKTEDISFKYEYSNYIFSADCLSEQSNIRTFATNGLEGRIPFIFARMCNAIEAAADPQAELNTESGGDLLYFKTKYIGDPELFGVVTVYMPIAQAKLNTKSCGDLLDLKRKYIGDAELFDLVMENIPIAESDLTGRTNTDYCPLFIYDAI